MTSDAIAKVRMEGSSHEVCTRDQGTLDHVDVPLVDTFALEGPSPPPVPLLIDVEEGEEEPSGPSGVAREDGTEGVTSAGGVGGGLPSVPLPLTLPPTGCTAGGGGGEDEEVEEEEVG